MGSEEYRYCHHLNTFYLLWNVLWDFFFFFLLCLETISLGES